MEVETPKIIKTEKAFSYELDAFFYSTNLL